jgi:DNA-binding response OmpR family regulator
LSRQGYELLGYLYDRANQLCTQQEIVEHIFGRKYDDTDPSHRSLVHTAIRRLRGNIEDDPDSPRYLLTERGGYRLVTQPNQ